MKNIFNISLLCAFTVSATLSSCSDKDVVIPENPVEPTAVNVTTEKIIYEANPRMYGTDNGLVNLTAKVADIKNLGTDILWVMPVNTPGVEKSIGSPYCVKDYNTVNPKLGTMTDFKALVTKTHEQGMQIILDWVANHTAWDCAWITEHPDWYVRDANGDIVSPNGWTDVAELNYDNTQMRAAMIEALSYWVENTGIDGFRLDNADGVPDDFWSEAIAALRKINPDLFILAETSRQQAYTYGADMIYGWAFASDLSGLFNGKDTQYDLINAVSEETAQTPDNNATRVMHYSINHDTAAENTIQQLYGTEAGAEMGYALALFLGGTPMFYTSQLTDYTGTASFFTYENASFNADKADRIKHINSIFKATAEVRQGPLTGIQADKCVLMQYELGQSHLVMVANPNNRAFDVKMPIEVAGLPVTEMVSGTQTTMPVSETLEPYQYKIYLK